MSCDGMPPSATRPPGRAAATARRDRGIGSGHLDDDVDAATTGRIDDRVDAPSSGDHDRVRSAAQRGGPAVRERLDDEHSPGTARARHLYREHADGSRAHDQHVRPGP